MTSSLSGTFPKIHPFWYLHPSLIAYLIWWSKRIGRSLSLWWSSLIQRKLQLKVWTLTIENCKVIPPSSIVLFSKWTSMLKINSNIKAVKISVTWQIYLLKSSSRIIKFYKKIIWCEKVSTWLPQHLMLNSPKANLI